MFFKSLLLWLERRVARLEVTLEELRDAAAVQKATQERAAARAAPAPINEAEAAAPQTPMDAPPPSQPPVWQPPRVPPGHAPGYQGEEPAAARVAHKASAIETVRNRFGLAGAQWEAIIGGSWLNKLGVLVFVIGIALRRVLPD